MHGYYGIISGSGLAPTIQLRKHRRQLGPTSHDALSFPCSATQASNASQQAPRPLTLQRAPYAEAGPVLVRLPLHMHLRQPMTPCMDSGLPWSRHTSMQLRYRTLAAVTEAGPLRGALTHCPLSTCVTMRQASVGFSPVIMPHPQKLGLSAGHLRTAFTSLASTLTTLRTDAAAAGGGGWGGAAGRGGTDPLTLRSDIAETVRRAVRCGAACSNWRWWNAV